MKDKPSPNSSTCQGRSASTRQKSVLLSLAMSMLAFGSSAAFAEENSKLAELALQKVALSDVSKIKSVHRLGGVAELEEQIADLDLQIAEYLETNPDLTDPVVQLHLKKLTNAQQWKSEVLKLIKNTSRKFLLNIDIAKALADINHLFRSNLDLHDPVIKDKLEKLSGEYFLKTKILRLIENPTKKAVEADISSLNRQINEFLDGNPDLKVPVYAFEIQKLSEKLAWKLELRELLKDPNRENALKYDVQRISNEIKEILTKDLNDPQNRLDLERKLSELEPKQLALKRISFKNGDYTNS